MPKKPPSSVVEHRISFQDKERELLERYINAEAIKDVGDFAVKGMAAAGVLLAGYGAYWVCKEGWGFGQKAADAIVDWWDGTGGAGFGDSNVGIKEVLLGKPTHTDEDTGRTYTNPFAGVPILGPLFGTGINLGIATSQV